MAANPLWVRDLVEVLLASVHEELLIVTRASCGAGALDPASGGGRVGEDGRGQIEGDAEELEHLLQEAQVLRREDVGVYLCLPRQLRGNLQHLRAEGTPTSSRRQSSRRAAP